MRKPTGGNRLSFIPPLMPTLVEKPPEGDGWIHEVKFDGYRSQIIRDAGGARIYTRRGLDAKAASEMKVESAPPIRTYQRLGKTDVKDPKRTLKWVGEHHPLAHKQTLASRSQDHPGAWQLRFSPSRTPGLLISPQHRCGDLEYGSSFADDGGF